MVSGIRGIGKTVLLKKIKKDLNNDYFTCYIDLSATSSYQMGELTEIGIMEHFYESFMEEYKSKKFFSTFKKLSKYFKTKDFSVADVVDAGGLPLPLLKTADNYKKLSSFVLDLPQAIYEEHQDEIKGTILFIDEFQVLNDLGGRLDAFLWYLRSVIQSQKNVSYVFSGSLTSSDTVISKIAGSEGAFGGRMLNVEIHPFSRKTVKDYLKEKSPSLVFDETGFERFYNCTKGIPFYVNTFAKLLEKDVKLDEDKVKNEFQRTLPYLAIHLINQWSRLTLQEQGIITQLLDKPLRRKTISGNMNVTSGSLSKPLNKLQDTGLVKLKENHYTISEPILEAWLKKEYTEKRVYPFRSI
jgi:AAA+ ATPase superfamily predicted ATPase